MVLYIDIYKGHLSPVRIFDSLAKHNHKTEILAKTIFDTIATNSSENKKTNDQKRNEEKTDKEINGEPIKLC